MKRILINALQPEEVRVALVDGQYLYNLDIESAVFNKKKNNIYKGIITKVEPGLEACFVDYGQDRHGFLPFKEISREYFSGKALEKPDKPDITASIREGQEIITQVIKEERGGKGAALTTFISIAGRYLVLMANNPRASGISRRIDGSDRSELKQSFRELKIPKGSGVIVRTAGVGRTTEELQWDLDYLHHIWDSVTKAAQEKPAPFLIYEKSNVVVRVLREHFRSDIGEILIDNKEIFEFAHAFMSKVMPNELKKLKFYKDDTPMFSRFQVEAQIESAFHHKVNLPSGGSIVIDPTEALISIDINSAKATSGVSIEETALAANLEAADEIARQLRLRDVGGLIVVDFIDMMDSKNQRAVELKLKEAVKPDKAKIQFGKISRFGLLEMSRQRLNPSLGESAMMVCPRCKGNGSIRGNQSLSLSVFRLIQEEVLKDHTGMVVAQTPVDVATYLLNEKRSAVKKLEKRTKARIVIIPNPSLESPDYNIERIAKARGRKEIAKSSYDMAVYARKDVDVGAHLNPKDKFNQQDNAAAVQQIIPQMPAPKPKVAKKPGGVLTRLLSSVFKPEKKSAPEIKKTRNPSGQRKPKERNGKNYNRKTRNYRRKPAKSRN